MRFVKIPIKIHPFWLFNKAMCDEHGVCMKGLIMQNWLHVEEHCAVRAQNAKEWVRWRSGACVREGVFVYDGEASCSLSILKCVHNNLMFALEKNGVETCLNAHILINIDNGFPLEWLIVIVVEGLVILPFLHALEKRFVMKINQ